MIIDAGVYLKHFGKKGMRWGQRSANPNSIKKLSRKQKRFLANQEKAKSFMDTALKDPNVLIALNGHVIVTGKEFTDHMASGGLLNVKMTRIYAQQENPGGKYVLK